jgi:RND family efflux transporter MFP subunit
LDEKATFGWPFVVQAIADLLRRTLAPFTVAGLRSGIIWHMGVRMAKQSSILKALALCLPLPVPALADLAPVPCVIRPYDIVDLASPVAGIVGSVEVERGDTVTAGQLVARMDATLEEAELDVARARAEDMSAIDAAKARLKLLETVAERTEKLSERNAIADSVAEEARVEAEAARQTVLQRETERRIAGIEARAAEARLHRKDLISPVNGVVTDRLLSPGEYGTTEEPLLVIARVDTLRVEAFVPIGYYPDLTLGQVVTIEPEDPVGGQHPARIAVIDRVFDAASGTVGVLMDLPNDDLTIPAGLRCKTVFQ